MTDITGTFIEGQCVCNICHDWTVLKNIAMSQDVAKVMSNNYGGQNHEKEFRRKRITQNVS